KGEVASPTKSLIHVGSNESTTSKLSNPSQTLSTSPWNRTSFLSRAFEQTRNGGTCIPTRQGTSFTASSLAASSATHTSSSSPPHESSSKALPTDGATSGTTT